ncbi:hypothetical protein EMIHUDRAFT_449354 [Emiliania huxleyi CCMP1516]|uniref:1,3-beta-glucan synthase n=2 Tax=Emiliania huxleyi TaxID=2903 RepID=A0A0D3KF45_EMIH1|nr:hypothetical protein EMIHUDRAFT_449354 [Emiliania huxleyi CCMP1516]EOD34380.1 hypothetical protein EMIHUDRAFT_449354 [Emiliania huxleyi CCMP1516]|eukprot:XP_005786809.1 hypothetical protein EMIHUDRAFT_449354 [Emiliania huxleyi CCMP1516]
MNRAPERPTAGRPRQLQSWLFGWPESDSSSNATSSNAWDGSLIDVDTPLEELETVGLGDGESYRLVMSDEFETEGRRFSEVDRDPIWTAVARHDPTNGNLAYMTPQMVSTHAGALEIYTTNTGFRASRPAIWMLGNLGRATYPLSNDGLWPFSFGACDRARLGAAAVPGARRAGGVPEVDLLEARPCADIAAASDRPALAVAHNNLTIDQAIFPTVFRIGHVRFYQRASGRQRTSCSPPDHPTAGWIAQHWWANGKQAPPSVDNLLRASVLLSGCVAALGALALLLSEEHVRLALALLFGAFFCAALASAGLARYLGVSPDDAWLGPQTAGGDSATSSLTLSAGVPLRSHVWSFHVWNLSAERARAASLARLFADRLVYLACVVEAAVVGGLLLTILSELTLCLATAFSARALPRLLVALLGALAAREGGQDEGGGRVGSLSAAVPLPPVGPPLPHPRGWSAGEELSLLLFPLFLFVALVSGLAAIHVRKAFLEAATALCGAQLLWLGAASLAGGEAMFDAMLDVRHAVEGLAGSGVQGDLGRSSSPWAAPAKVRGGAVVSGVAGERRVAVDVCQAQPSVERWWLATARRHGQRRPRRAACPERRWLPPLQQCTAVDASGALGSPVVKQLCAVAAAFEADFGFQRSVVCNQLEHLLRLLAARAARLPFSAPERAARAADSLHAHLFASYFTWCEHAANLRHASEAVWWLFHQLSDLAKPLPRPFALASVAPLYASLVHLFCERAHPLNYDDVNEAFWRPDCLGWSLEGSGAGSAAAQLRGLAKEYRERRSWLHMLGAFEHVYFAHWIMLRLMLGATLGLNTCIAAEFGAGEESDAALRVLQFEATLVVDVQAYRVLSGLLQLWARFPTCDPPAKLDAVLRVALDLLLSLALNVALWFSLRDQHLHHWAMALLLSIAVFVRPTLSSLRFLVVNALRMHCECTANALRIACELPANSNCSLFGIEVANGPLPARHVRPTSWHVRPTSWSALAFWLTLFSVHCLLVQHYIADALVVDTLGLLYSYFGRAPRSSGIGLGQLFVLLLCIWVPVILFFLVSFSLTFTLWDPSWNLLGLPQLLAAHFDPAADRFEQRWLASRPARLPPSPGGAWAVSAGGRSVSLPAVANGSRDGALPPDEDAPADLSGLRLAAQLLGRLPARGGWGFAQCWNTMLHEMRRQDLVDNSEETRLHALLAGCPVESLPTLCRLSLAGAADIAMAVVWPLLGAAHQPDVALALRALAAVVPPIAPATDASAAGSAGQSRPCGALPPGLRSERVLYGLRKALQRPLIELSQALVELCEAIFAMIGLSRDLSRLDLTASLNDLTAALSLARRRRGVTRVRIADIASAEGAADEVRGALGAAANALQATLAHPTLGFWADSSYASASLASLLRHEPNLEAIAVRLRRMLSLSPTPRPLRSNEAMRRLRHWLRSLKMDAPEAPPVAEMQSWSILTPVYKETVLYSMADLEEESNDGRSFIEVLRGLHRDEWANFAQRLGESPSALSAGPSAAAVGLDARPDSRAHRMMYYESALAFLVAVEAGSAGGGPAPPLPAASQTAAASALAQRKVGYVCACQVYGDYKRAGDPRAVDIEALMHAFPSLRVAYGGVRCESRVGLPGNPILGEGKPENQNVALPFCHGERVQMVDMNQEGYWEEALKMRPLLQEFESSAKAGPVTVIGFPEHIFTQSSGFVTAIFIGLQERYFGSFVQRHPDLLDKLHFATRGGVSKASKEINLSEDIFSGYKTVLAGGCVVFREYHLVGKGRPTNLMEITGFFAKLSSGSAASLTTRDVARFAASAPLVKLFSYYYSAIAFYVHDVIVMHVTVLIPYLLAMLALVGLDHRFNNYEAQPLSLFALLPLLLSLMTALPLLRAVPALCMVLVERGPRRALSFLLGMAITASPVYFIFVAQTKSFHFARTARDYALAAAVLLPVGALAALRLPGVVHRALIFQRSHGLILYSSVLAAVALAYALSSLDWG